MNKRLYISDIRWHASFSDMIREACQVGDKTTYYYNPDYINGKTMQCEIFPGIWIVYHDFMLNGKELLPVEEGGVLEMNYCIDGRCELDYSNRRIFYVAPGDFAVAILKNGRHKHNFPLGTYRGISMVTTREALDCFLRSIFGKSDINSSFLFCKLEACGGFTILPNNRYIQELIGDIISEGVYWRERAVLKFSELILFLISSLNGMPRMSGKYFTRRTIEKVKLIMMDITQNLDEYTSVGEVGSRYDIGIRTFSDCFKEVYGKTYYAFIKEFRIKKAAGMLLTTKHTIGNIAVSVGYQNASKFSKAFRDVMGIAPGEFRKK